MKSPAAAICRMEILVALRSRAFWFAAAAMAAASCALARPWRAASGASGADFFVATCSALARMAPFCAAFATADCFRGGRGDSRLEAVLAAPVPFAEVAVGKFAAGFALALMCLAACALAPLAALRASGAFPTAAQVVAPLAAGISAVALETAALAAFGTFASLLAGGGAAAAAATAIGGSFAAAAALGDFSGFPPPELGGAFDPTRFAEGAVDSRFAVLCVSAAALFAFLSVRLLETRAWLLRAAAAVAVTVALGALSAGCESSDPENDDWTENKAETQPAQKQQTQSGSAAQPKSSQAQTQNQEAAQPAAQASAPAAASATPDAGVPAAADQISFGALHWQYGGKPKASGARASGVSISGLSVSKGGLSFKYGRDLSAWGLSHGEAGAVACLFVQNASGKWVGGKFDWISSSRTSRSFENVLHGYGGWSLADVPNPCAVAFVIVSQDGTKRSNVLVGTWTR